MTSITRAFLLLIFGSLASIASGQGFQVNVQDAPVSNPVGSHASDWTFRLQHRNVHVHWKCYAFTHTQSPQTASDAQFSVSQVRSLGPLIVSPTNFHGSTDVYSGKSFTSFDMELRGTGRTDVRVNVAIDTANAAAGKHECAIELTIVGL